MDKDNELSKFNLKDENENLIKVTKEVKTEKRRFFSLRKQPKNKSQVNKLDISSPSGFKCLAHVGFSKENQNFSVS